MRISWVFIAGLACGSPKPAKPTPTAPATKCPNAADHLLSLMTGSKDAPVERLDAMRAGFNERCLQDGWSPEAQQCFLGLASLKEVGRCEPMLTAAQVEAFVGQTIEAQRGQDDAPAAAEPPPADR